MERERQPLRQREILQPVEPGAVELVVITGCCGLDESRKVEKNLSLKNVRWIDAMQATPQ